MTVETRDFFDREAKGIKCPACKVGHAEKVETTPEEWDKWGCGRDAEFDSECCARAFACAACGERIVGSAKAPEMNW